MRQVVKAAADVRVQDPWAGAVLSQRGMERFDRIHRAAPWSETIGVGFKARFPFRFQSRLDDCLHVSDHGGTKGAHLTKVQSETTGPMSQCVCVPCGTIYTPAPPSDAPT